MKVRDTARLHHTTVTNHKAHTKKTNKAPRRTSMRDLQRVKVDPRVWEVALELSDHDCSRLEVISETEVIVKNSR